MTNNTRRGTGPSRDLTEKSVVALAAEAEHGYDVDHVVAQRSTRGRPLSVSGPALVEAENSITESR